MKNQRLPEGYTDEQIREIAEHYENQTEAEAEAEWEAALSDPRYAFVQVPVELVDDVRKLIAQKTKGSAGKSGQARIAEPKAKYGGK